MSEQDSRNAPLSRDSHAALWVSWATRITENYPNSMHISAFAKGFKYGLGSQNITVLGNKGLINTIPLPDKEHSNMQEYLDPAGLIVLLHMIGAPKEARTVITDFFYKKGILTLPPEYRIFFVNSPGDY